MTGADLRRLLLLAALWGGSFLFIRVAVPTLGPIATVFVRVGLAGLTLLLYAASIRKPLHIREWWRQYLTLGVLNTALPFVLICFAETRLPASVAAILNATSPLFGAAIAAIWLKDPLTRDKAIGIALALLGVVLLVGWGALKLDSGTLIAIGASLLAAAFYGLSGVYTRAKAQGAPPLGMAVGSLLGASLLMTPIVPFAPPAASPSSAVVLCLLGLTLLSTAFAYLLYFRLVVDIGPTRALTVTFLTPAFGVVWGALFLHEPLSSSKLVGCAIILVGTGFVTGVYRRKLAAG